MSVLEIERAGGVATLRLNRPEALNALSRELTRALRAALEDCARDDDVRAVLLTGAGRGFCAGADLSDIAAELDAGSRNGSHGDTDAGLSAAGIHAAIRQDSAPLAEALLRYPKPLVAAVNGPCAGAGMGLALSADVLLAAHDATFSVVFVRRGLVPDYGVTHLLPRLVGLRLARQLCLTGQVLSAEEAEAMGLVTGVVPADRLMREATAAARRLAEGPTVALRLTKELLAESFALGPAQAVEREFAAQALCFTTSDAVEGVSAFLGKRQPRFTGR